MLQKNNKKKAIISAAIEIFSQSDYKSSSIAEIAKKANVAEGSIYQYFKDKEDLFFSIPVARVKEFSRELDLHLQGITGSLNKIRKFIWFYLYFFTNTPEYSRIVLLEMRVSKRFTSSKMYGSFKRSTSRILEIIREGQDEGILRTDVNIFVMRQLILGMLEHMVTRWLIKNQKYDLLEHYEDACRLILGGIVGRKGSGRLSESKMVKTK